MLDEESKHQFELTADQAQAKMKELATDNYIEEGKMTGDKKGKPKHPLSVYYYMIFFLKKRREMWEKYPNSDSKEIVSRGCVGVCMTTMMT